MYKCRKCNGTRMAIKPNAKNPAATSGIYMKQLAYLMEGRYCRKTAALAADLGVSRQTLYAWKRGATAPSRAHEYRLLSLYEEVKQDEKAD